MAEKLYTVAQVSEHLQMSRMSVYRLMDSGEIKSLKIGRARRVADSALQDFIDRSQGVSA